MFAVVVAGGEIRCSEVPSASFRHSAGVAWIPKSSEPKRYPDNHLTTTQLHPTCIMAYNSVIHLGTYTNPMSARKHKNTHFPIRFGPQQ